MPEPGKRIIVVGSSASTSAHLFTGGLGWFPELPWGFSGIASNGASVIDAATKKIAAIGRVRWKDNASHDLQKVHLYNGNVVGASGSTIRVSAQSVASGVGPPPAPNGTQTAYRDVALNTLTSNTYFATGIMSSDGTDGGTAMTLAHGAQVAIVVEFQSFFGADSIEWLNNLLDRPMAGAMMVKSADSGATWTLDSWRVPNCYLRATDGTLGVFENALSSNQNTFFSSASGAPERVQHIRFPIKVEIDGMYWHGTLNSTGSMTTKIVTGTAGSQSDVVGTSLTWSGRHEPDTSGRMQFRAFASPVVLNADTDYWIVFTPDAVGVYLAYQYAQDVNFWVATPWASLPYGTRTAGVITEDDHYRLITGLRLAKIWG